MASATNSYDALLSGSDPVASKDVKRRKNAKAKEQGISQIAHAQQLVSVQASSPASASAAAHPHLQHEDDSHDGFMPAVRPQRFRRGVLNAPSGGSTSQSSGAPETALGPRITAAEASHLVEQAASGMKGPDRLRLWREWLAQLQELVAGNGVRYSGPKGTLVDFRQALLASRALELSVEGCLLEVVTAAAEPALADVFRELLAPSLPPTVPAILASRVVQLSGLAAADGEVARRSAAAAVSSLIAALKAASADEAPAQVQRWPSAVASAAGGSLEDVEKGLTVQAAALARAIQCKDKARLARAVLNLSEDRLSLLAGGSGESDSGSGTSSGVALREASRSLANWSSMLQDSQRRAAANRGGAQSRGQQLRGQEEAWQREDAQLARTQAELAAEIRSREEALRALQHRAAAVEEQRRLGAQRQSGSQGQAGSAAPQDMAVLEQQLSVVHALYQVLQVAAPETLGVQGGGAASEQDVRSACVAYVRAVQQALESTLEYMSELLKRTSETAEQLARVQKQGEDLLRANLSEKAADNGKQQQRLAARVQDGMMASKEAWREAKEAEQGLHRYGALMSQLPAHVGNAVGSVQQLLVRIECLQAEVTLAGAPRPAGAVPRRRTTNELAALLADSRLDVTVAAPASAPIPTADPASAVMERMAELEAELASTRQEMCVRAAPVTMPPIPATNGKHHASWHPFEQADGRVQASLVLENGKSGTVAADSRHNGSTADSPSKARGSEPTKSAAAAVAAALSGIGPWSPSRETNRLGLQQEIADRSKRVKAKPLV